MGFPASNARSSASPDGLFVRTRLQSLNQVAHLAHMIVQMSRADEKKPKARLDGLLTGNGSEKPRLVLRRKRLRDQCDRPHETATAPRRGDKRSGR